MAKMDIKSLLRELNGELSQFVETPGKWGEFLRSVAWNYKYTFQNQLLIYSQRPDARACAGFDVWNTKLHRYIARGSKGIALLNDTGDKISYVFDVSDTRSKDDKPLKLWDIHNDNIAGVLDIVNQEHNSGCETVEDIVVSRVNDFLEESGSLYLPDGDIRNNKEFVDAFYAFVKYSAYVAVLSRCGLDDAANNYSEMYLQDMGKLFDTNEKIVALGVAVSSVSEDVLREIEHNVRVVDKYNLKVAKEKNSAEAVNYENELQTSRGILDSGYNSDRDGGRETGSNGDVEIKISSIEQTDSLHDAVDERGVDESFNSDRNRGSEADRVIDETDDKSSSGTREEGVSDSVGATHGISSDDSRGNGEEGIDLPLEDLLFPTVEEQPETIEEAVESNGEFELSQEDVDFILAYGSSIVDGKYRIYEYFQEKHNAKEKAEFLKNEYGTGGGTRVFPDGTTGWANHDSKGISISKHRNMLDPDIVLNWNKVQKRISELVKSGSYFNEKEMRTYPEYQKKMKLRRARHEVAIRYNSLVREFNNYLRDNGSADDLLNQHVLIDCSSQFVMGNTRTHTMSDGKNHVLSLIRESLNKIVIADSPFKERAEEILASLQEDTLKTIGFNETELEESENNELIFVPSYKVGDLFFNGATKYNIIEVKDNSVYLSNVEFALDSLELSKEDFEKIVKENPSNNHLLVKYSMEDYNKLINHAVSVVDEVEKSLLPDEENEFDVVNVVRVGDFFEIRGDSAVELAEDLDLVVTSRTIDGEHVPMVGFPVRYLDLYNEKLIGEKIVLREAPSTELSEDSEIVEEAEPIKEVKRNSLIARNYDALERLAPGILNGDYTYLRFEREGLEPLAIESVGDNYISVMHTFVQNGDMMRDPDVVLLVDNKNKTVSTASYEMSSTGMYKEYIDFNSGKVIDEAGQKETNSFVADWLKNIEKQQYLLVRGETRAGEEVYFDSDGKEISKETFEGLKEKFQVRLYRSADTPDKVQAYVAAVSEPLVTGHIIEDEREVFDYREAAENAVDNFNTVFGFDEEFRNEILEKVPEPFVHRYYSTQRPVGPGTYPKHADYPVVNVVNFDERTFVEEIDRAAWGYIEFARPLPLKQAEDYELVLAPFVTKTQLDLDESVASEKGDELAENTEFAVRLRLDENENSGIYVYVEKAGIPCPETDVEVGSFDNEATALKFRLHIENTLDSTPVYRDQQYAALLQKEKKAAQDKPRVLRPVVYCEWSEHADFEDEKEYSFVEFNSLMKKLDEEVLKLKEEYRAKDDYYPYFKTKFVIRFPDGYEYEGRQDIGDGDGSLVDHVRTTSEYNLKKIKEDGYGGLYKGDEREAAIKELEVFLSSYLPLLENEVQENEVSYDKEAYNIGYGSLGNGTTVWNSADIDKETNDYRTIAHIADDGTVKFYVDNLPNGVKAEIKSKAIDFSKNYINDVINMSEEKFKYWYFNQMLKLHPTAIPGKDIRIQDYIGCYNALHADSFVRDVDKTLIAQLEGVVKANLKESSVDTRQEVINMIDRGEITNEDISSALEGIDTSQINNIDDVYDLLASKYIDEPSKPQEKVVNFKIDNLELGVGGPKEKYRNNVAAIRLLKQLETEGRQANADEQSVLSKYVGWGGLDKAFDGNNSSWAQEYKELQELLTTEEYRSAKASTLTSFYTPPVVINSIYEALSNLGFKRGNVLEPACGVGNFFGMMPDEFSDSNLYGVELDSISGRIAKQLYPDAKIAVKGYEDTNFKDGFFDIAIGNVPFGQFQVNDKDYNNHSFLIHDYFFAKTLDKVRPGGWIAFITSKGTLDKQSPEVRKYIAQRAELVGAIRLPNNTFSANAGTSVTSDIIFLKKRDKTIDIEPDWVHLGFTEDGLPINSYFVEHPEMVLGHMEMDRMQYGREDTTCVPLAGRSLEDQLNAAIQSINGEISLKAIDFDVAIDEADIVTETSIPADPDVRNFSYTVVDDEVYYRVNNEMVKQEFNATREQRVKGLVEIRDCLRQLIDLQRYNHSDREIENEQSRLNKLYDKYTAKYGLINSRGNALAFQDDSSYYLLCSLENLDKEGNLESKADMFTKRTIKTHVPVASVGTPSEALAVSISEKAKVDLDYMSDLADMSKEDIVAGLQGVIYRVPGRFDNKGDAVYVTADEYLSGNVREKLKDAKRAAEIDSAFNINVLALEKVIPKDLEPQEISLRLGSIWIPDDVVNEFMWQLLDTPTYSYRDEPEVKAHYNEVNGEWVIENKNWYGWSVKVNTTYGTSRMNAYDIILNTLNLKTVEIYDYVEDHEGKRKRVLNKNETIVAQQKQELIKNEFLDWVWKDPERRQRLVRIYNDKFNSIKLREYNGEHLVFEGMNPEIKLMDHQRDAIAHAIYGGNTLFAHEVGAGKTYEMVATAMESKRLGLCSKSLMVVPNHLLMQWANEFYQLYPSANILVATKKDFEPANRKKFCSRIATGDYDAIIIGHSQFEKIPLSVDVQTRFIQEELDEIENGILELKREQGHRASVKSLEKTKKSLQLRLEKLNDIKQDDVITFEELGVDKVFVDEAHYFKNLFLYTKMRNVAGIPQTEAKKSSDLYMKTRYLNELTGNKGVVFATGTPISNSMTEAFTMQRYLQYDTLKENGLLHFDAWASTFGEIVSAVELAPEGTGYRQKDRFAKFYNIPEFMSLFKQIADIKTGDDLDLPKPDADFHIVQAEPTKLQEEIVESLGERAKAVRDGGIDPHDDNMLKITNDGRLLGLDQRCFDDALPDAEDSKVNMAVDNIYNIWDEYKEDKLTQLVFCDISTPNGKDFTVYEDVKEKLIDKGIPANEIAFIHDANTDVKKDRLFAKVREGEVRILIGSTFKMGTGTNVQQKLIAMHDLDCPWRPSDLEQRLGRILRQGNEQDRVQVYRYVTQGTFDAYLWQIVENKQKFISQIMTSKSPVRVADDIDDAALSYAEIKSLCIKDPRIKEKMELDVDVAKLKLVRANFLSQKYRMEDDINVRYPATIKRLEQSIIGYKADIEHVKECTTIDEETKFSSMVVNGVCYTEKKQAGEALLQVCKEIKDTSKIEVGEYRGFKMLVQYDPFTTSRVLYLKGALSHSVKLGDSDIGNIQRIDNLIVGFEKELVECQQKLETTKADLEVAKVEVVKEFPQEKELKDKVARLDELEAILRMDEKGGVESDKDNERPEPDGLNRVLSDAYSRAGECRSVEYGDRELE